MGLPILLFAVSMQSESTFDVLMTDIGGHDIWLSAKLSIDCFRNTSFGDKPTT